MSKGFSVQPLCCLQTPDSCLHSRGSSWAKIPVRRAKSSASVQVAQVESAQTSGRFAQATSSSRRPLSPFSRRPRSVREENAEEKRIRKKSSRDTPEGSDPLRVRVQAVRERASVSPSRAEEPIIDRPESGALSHLNVVVVSLLLFLKGKSPNKVFVSSSSTSAIQAGCVILPKGEKKNKNHPTGVKSRRLTGDRNPPAGARQTSRTTAG